MINLSIVCASNEDPLLLDLMDSFSLLDKKEQIELILVLDACSDSYLDQIQMRIDEKKLNNIKVIHAAGLTRCQRKDAGTEVAKSDYVCFMDSDCLFQKDYLVNIMPHLFEKEVIRGAVHYKSGTTWIGTMNSYYREIADTELFQNETFSPNLIIRKSLLKNVGGWSKDNIDEQDDFILSQRIKKVMKQQIHHIKSGVVIHIEDTKLKKLRKSWIGYGLGYGFRYWKENADSEGKMGKLSLFLKYLPPFPYRIRYGAGYFVFCLYHYLYMCRGYFQGLKKFANYRFGSSNK